MGGGARNFPMLRRFQNQVALVTGGSGGIGQAICRELASEGATLYIAGRDQKRADATASLCSTFGQHETLLFELSSPEEIRKACNNVKLKSGRLDILVHCAGLMYHGSLADLETDWLDQQYAANVRGPLLLSQLMLPLLKKPRGQMVFVNSSAALTVAPGRGQYSAMQHALKCLTDTLRQEVNSDDVRVLSIYLGRTATPRIAALSETEHKPYRPDLLMQPRDVALMVVHALATPWTAEVTDISMRPMRKT